MRPAPSPSRQRLAPSDRHPLKGVWARLQRSLQALWRRLTGQPKPARRDGHHAQQPQTQLPASAQTPSAPQTPPTPQTGKGRAALPKPSPHLKLPPRSRAAARSLQAPFYPGEFDWVIPGQLALGPLPHKSWGDALQGQGIRAIVSLCGEAEGPLPLTLRSQFRCVRVALPDSRQRRSLDPEELLEATDLIHWQIRRGQPVYVHCLAGIERSPLVCIAYLCRYRQMDFFDAVNWLNHVHGPSRPLPNQLKILRQSLNQEG